MSDHLIQLKKEKRWVVWQLEETGTGAKKRTTKVPYTIRGKRASSTNPEDWATYKDAKAALDNFGSGIGIVFTPEENLLGIDIDHVIENKKVVGPHHQAITDLIKAAKTYTEVSPSRTGLHLYVSINGSFPLSSNRHNPFEAYTSGRFFTFTEESFGAKKAIRQVSPKEALDLLKIIGYPWQEEASPEKAQAQALLTDPIISDEELTRRMFASAHGETIRALWDGSTEAYGGDESRADAAILNHLAFWSRKNPEQMERLWLSSKLGSREKTQKRKDYRTRSIASAIRSCKKVYEVPVDHTIGLELVTKRDKDKNEVPVQNADNIARILRKHAEFAGTLRQDVFRNVYEIKVNEVWQQFKDVDVITMQMRISVLFPVFSKVTKDMVYDAVLKIFDENRYDSAIDFVTGIEWDGEKRLDEWLHHTYGAPIDEYHTAVASNWLKGLVKRIIEPGCKFDYVLVLEGEQGVKKSTSLHILGLMPSGHSMHVETTMGMDSKDFFMQMQGKAIVEFSEGETLSRTEVKKMKAIITTQSDMYRPPYSRVSLDHPRRCVFAMTTNQDEYLKDETGNRRWLPVKVTLDQANIEWLSENRDQLLAEALHRVKAGETLYEFPEEATKMQQALRQVSDPNTQRIAEWYWDDQFMGEYKRNKGITITDAYFGALNGNVGSPMKKFDEMAIAGVFRAMGLVKRRKMNNGVQSMHWFPPDSLRSELSTDEFAEDELPFNHENS